MKFTSNTNRLYLLPYLLLLVLGAWYYFHIKPIALLDGDSFGYLAPAIKRLITGEWHKGERPLQYMFFLKCAITSDFRLNRIVIVQQLLALAGGALLTGAWITFVNSLKNPSILWHLAGYFMLAIYVSSTDLMYLTQFIGPELFSIFFMCALIFSLSIVFSGKVANNSRAFFLSLSIFTNLYIINPMPKWIFAGLFLELLLVAMLLRLKPLPAKYRIRALALPHLLYLLIVFIPETVIPAESTNLDRVFIEYEQMVFTHFDLLIRDKANFGPNAQLQDSMVQYFNEAKANEVSNPLIGFSSNYLMWDKGTAKDAIYNYYKGNYDSIAPYYKRLCRILITKYPLSLTKQILRQVWAFYVPNKIVHKNLHETTDLADSYLKTRCILNQFDESVIPLRGEWQRVYGGALKPDLTVFQYPATGQEAGLTLYTSLHLPFGTMFLFFLGFDYIFLGSMLLFFITRVWQGKIRELHLITLLYILIAIYVITIAIVHTFDMGRFIDTIYPFILITTFLAFLYWAQEMLNIFEGKNSDIN